MADCLEWLNDTCHWSGSNPLSEHVIHKGAQPNSKESAAAAKGDNTSGIVGWDNNGIDTAGFAAWRRGEEVLNSASLDYHVFGTIGSRIIGFDNWTQEVDVDGDEDEDEDDRYKPDIEPGIETPPTSQVPLPLKNINFRELEGHYEGTDSAMNPIPSGKYIDLANHQQVNEFMQAHYVDSYNGFKEPEYGSYSSTTVFSKRDLMKKPFIVLGSFFKKLSIHKEPVTGRKLSPNSSSRTKEAKDEEVQRVMDHYYVRGFSASEVLQEVSSRSRLNQSSSIQ
ncbi:hypothetical protein CANMA_004200 [Candida margitis]|uniref:uncharacterized protein n=1 Tax=Candida margitis TaxID=1775924 RepID=UPI002225BC17|nr:uncharacterized protein CANMA_004200 [Candida margitis]KAI5958474.1 hypothetical protein CANMA_004200 [Candida margitis]